ncbi:diguanylate cyclase (GGDEF)-like protein [Pelomonas saccharophila]|uniref:Diguanylate cyclase (GGDEF)-like protein n=1 Tax=Roseateles saccharophilus TaxID=304 RepID=A0ABU1YHZ2_ROSSA|nr:diguanylate cyclase [Roseateles saccharophilus]MDR7268455.1 diguanylate cyclase (GGDEF)-like protein [Roseateles saccharophilus]
MSQAPQLVNNLPASERAGMYTQLPQADSTAAFGLRVSRQFAQCRRKGEQLALLWLEIELRTRPDNSLGPAERDHLMQTVSLRLRNRVRGADEVVHMGEQCFAVLLVAAGAAEAGLVEQRLRQALRGAYGVDGRLMQVGVRLGTAVYPQAGRNGAELAEAARANLPEAGGD